MRRLSLLLLLLFFMGASSCQVSQMSTRRVFLPSEATLSMQHLAKKLSRATGFQLMPDDNLMLYAFVADWYHVPYRYGGVGMKGTDCSAFVMKLINEVYGGSVPRSSAAHLMQLSNPVLKKNLKEGDLVFFNFNNRCGGAASHVGVYLRDGRFVHASTGSGVIVSSLSEPTYRRSYIGAGDIR